MLFEAIEERRQTLSTEERRQPLPTEEPVEKLPLLTQILDALQATEDSSKNLADDDKEGRNVSESSDNLAGENKGGNTVEEASTDQVEVNDRTEETEKPSIKQESESEKVSKIVAVLEKLEQVHREQRDDLLEENQDLKNPGVTKVSKMQKNQLV